MVSGLPDRLVKELNILSTEPGNPHMVFLWTNHFNND